MIDKTIALQVQQRALSAVRELMAILSEIEQKCPEQDYQALKRGIGLSVGRIQMEILEVINAQHPEIDDLNDVKPEAE
jgi:hypothetical protein